MKLEIDIECPACGAAFSQKVEKMRPGQTRSCPSCGAEIRFSGDDGRKAQKALDDLKETLSDIDLDLKF